MKKMYFIIALMAIMIAAASVGLAHILTMNTDSFDTVDSSDNMSEAVTEPSTEVSTEDKAQLILDTMTLDDKINQLFIVTPEALTGVNTATAAGNTTKQAIAKHPVGGVIYFSHNFINAAQAKELISKTKAMGNESCKIPLFMSIDEEGGTVARLANSPNISVDKVENMSVIGAGGDPQRAYEAGKTIGSYLNEYGFNLDFAPVSDVLTNRANEVVKDRSFGSDPEMVSNMSEQFSKALNQEGVYSCYKHFPGHGATAGDTHEGFAYTDKTYEELEASELIPFKDAIRNSADFIMVGHISLPNVIGDNTPASISSVIVTDILRNKLGYNNIIITDALNMGALTTLYKSDEIAVKALNAGADMLLMPEDFNLAYTGVKNAVDNGEITEERIDESVKRIINVKLKLLH